MPDSDGAIDKTPLEDSQEQLSVRRKLQELGTRITNMESGRNANAHHGAIKRMATSLVDGNAGFYASHGIYATTVGVGAASIAVGVAVPPLGIALATLAVTGFAADRLSGAHDSRKDLRDIERFANVLNTAEQTAKTPKAAGQATEIRTRLMDEYTRRYCESEKISYEQLQEASVDPQNADTTSKIPALKRTLQTMARVAPPAAAKGAAVVLKVDGLAMAASAVGAAGYGLSTAIGGALRVKQVMGRSSLDVRMSNYEYATMIVKFVKETGADLSSFKGEFDKICQQAEWPRPYIAQWQKTYRNIGATAQRKDELTAMVEDFAAEKDPKIRLQKLADLKLAIKEFGKDSDYYKGTMQPDENRLKFWKDNHVGNLAKSLDVFKDFRFSDRNPEASLANLKGLIGNLGGVIEKAYVANNELVGEFYADNNRDSIKPKPFISLRQQARELQEVGSVKPALTQKITQRVQTKIMATTGVAGTGAVAVGVPVVDMLSDVAEPVAGVMDSVATISGSILEAADAIMQAGMEFAQTGSGTVLATGIAAGAAAMAYKRISSVAGRQDTFKGAEKFSQAEVAEVMGVRKNSKVDAETELSGSSAVSEMAKFNKNKSTGRETQLGV